MEKSEILFAVVGVGLTIWGIYYARKQDRQTNIKQPKEQKEHLILQFKMNQQLNQTLIDELSEYATNNDKWNEQFVQHLTIRNMVDGLYDSKKNNLSDTQLNFLETEKFTADNMRSVLKSLETQFENLQILHASLKSAKGYK